MAVARAHTDSGVIADGLDIWVRMLDLGGLQHEVESANAHEGK